LSFVLEIKDLSIQDVDIESKKLLDSVSFSIKKDERFALVGESGSGKSITCLSILGLLSNNLKASGEIFFNGEYIPFKELKRLRGSFISYIPQNPISSLNPIKKIKDHLIEVLSIHRRDLSDFELKEKSLKILDEVRLEDPLRVFESYPFELSGGMCQRILIALSLIAEPDLIIADEPTTALDIITQSEIIKLIIDLLRKRGTSLLLISHDLALVTENTDQIAVLKNGKVVENRQTSKLITSPEKEYTKSLLEAFIT